MANRIKKVEHLYRSKLPDIEISDHLPLHSYCFERVVEFARTLSDRWGDRQNLFLYIGGVDFPQGRCRSGEVGVAAGASCHASPSELHRICVCVDGGLCLGRHCDHGQSFYKLGEIAKQAKAARAHIIVTQVADVEKLADLQSHDVLVITINDAPKEGCQHISVLTEADETQCAAVKIHLDDVVVLPYSSRTTGLPKGMMLTHKGLVSSVAQ